MKLLLALVLVIFTPVLIATPTPLERLAANFPAQVHQKVETSQGVVHYQDVGDHSAPVILLVHGVSGPQVVWDHNVETLLKLGFRVVRFDLFGRGFSDRLAKSDYALKVYHRQIADLLEALEITQPIYLMGSSFGCVLVSDFALRQPEKVRGLILIGPAGFPIQVPFLARLRDVPLLGSALTSLFGTRTILAQNRKYFVDENPPREFWNYFTNQLAIPGSKEAMLLTMKNSPVQNFISSYAALGKRNIKVGVIWGKQDVTFAYENYKTLLGVIPHAKLISIESAGHIPQFERPTESNHALGELLGGMK